MKTNLSFCMLRLGCLLLFGTAAATITLPTSLHGAATREITVGTRWPQLIATNGKVFRNVKFTYVSPREVRFMHTDGIGSLPLGEVVMADNVTVAAPDASMPPELTMGPLGSMMTAQERKISGIDKLSNDEQATLAKWVQGTVEERLREELERRGLPPTFAPLALVPRLETGAAAGIDTAPAGAAAPASSDGSSAMLTPAVTAGANNAAFNSAAQATMPRLMAGAPGKVYVPSSPLLPPPASTSTSDSSPVSAAPQSAAGSRTSPPLPGTLARGRQVKMGYQGVVESSIAGEFRGLETGRQFRLVNGQTWQQQESFVQDHLAYKPRVTIYPANDGWMMAVDGVDKAVRVMPMD